MTPELILGVPITVVAVAVGYLFKVLRDHDQSMVQHATLIRSLQDDADAAKAELATIDERIATSRHMLRNEFQVLVGNVQNDITKRLDRMETKIDRLVERGQ